MLPNAIVWKLVCVFENASGYNFPNSTYMIIPGADHNNNNNHTYSPSGRAKLWFFLIRCTPSKFNTIYIYCIIFLLLQIFMLTYTHREHSYACWNYVVLGDVRISFRSQMNSGKSIWDFLKRLHHAPLHSRLLAVIRTKMGRGAGRAATVQSSHSFRTPAGISSERYQSAPHAQAPTADWTKVKWNLRCLLPA